MKGQISLLQPRPGLEFGYIDPANDLYMFPRSDGVILGGSHEIGQWDPAPDPVVAKRILDGNTRLLAWG